MVLTGSQLVSWLHFYAAQGGSTLPRLITIPTWDLALVKSCLSFGVNDCKVILKPRKSYVRKKCWSPTPILSSAFCASMLRAPGNSYFQNSILYVTRSMASSWAWARGISTEEICLVGSRMGHSGHVCQTFQFRKAKWEKPFLFFKNTITLVKSILIIYLSKN